MTYYYPIPDISRYQHPVNPQIMWDAGARLVIIRCTVGDYYTDTRFVEYWDMFKEAGFLVGVYHVNTPEYSVSSQMARLFGPLGLNGRIPDVPIVLDCELTRGQSKSVITANIIGCLADIEDLDERAPIVYTRASWWNPNVNPSNLFEKYPLMVARYSNAATHPWNDSPLTLKPHSFTDWALWQWSADGNWKGAEYGVGSAHIDLNRGNAETLAGTLALLNKTPAPPPPDPIGEIVFPETYVTATVTALPAGMNYRNCRTRPDSVGGDAGSIEGKVYLFQAYPCWQMVVNAEGTWYLVELPDKSFGWVLGVMPSGVVYLTLTQEPIPPAEGVPMTEEQLNRLEAVEATAAQHELEITILQNTAHPPFTHKIKTTAPNGVKLDAYPAGGEAAMLPDDTPVRLLSTKEWKGQRLYAALIGETWVSGWLEPSEVETL